MRRETVSQKQELLLPGFEGSERGLGYVDGSSSSVDNGDVEVGFLGVVYGLGASYHHVLAVSNLNLGAVPEYVVKRNQKSDGGNDRPVPSNLICLNLYCY